MIELVEQGGDAVEAWNSLGLRLMAQRRYGASVPCFEQAIALQFHHVMAHHYLAEALVQTDRVARAIVHCEYGLILQPDSSVMRDQLIRALLTQGHGYHRQDHLAEAQHCYQRILTLHPHHAEASVQLAIMALAERDLTSAQHHSQGVIDGSDSSFAELQRRGVACYHQGETLQAIACFIQLAAMQPDHAGPYNNLGMLVTQLGYHHQAVRCYQQALDKQPDSNSYHNLAISCYQLGRVMEAEQGFRAAIAMQPDYVQAHNSFGNFLQLQNRMGEAMEAFAAVLALDPDCNSADLWYHISQGSVWLAQGRVREGWKEWVWTWYQQKYRRIMLNDDWIVDHEPWNGVDDLAGKRLLVIAGGAGFGDDILWCRYISRLVTTYGARVTVFAPLSLVTLFKTIPAIEVVTRYPASSCFDAYIPLLALTHALDIPFPLPAPDPPYLTVPDHLWQQWQHHLQPYLGYEQQPCLTVGLCWMSGGAQTLWKPRSILHIEKLWPLFEVPHTRFFNVQTGASAAMLRRFPPGKLHDLSADLGDFLNTAAIFSQLDLLITVDSAYPHLAGAIGHPVWMLQADRNDARWMHDDETSHWYPSMRLFRQKRAGDWDEVIERVVAALHQAVAVKLMQVQDGRNPPT
ncbi:MAG: tetratricopeptide repeat protein [Magnetococcales bacterium]|nr:tetratricopeptide repeat protein [Magnetococcales bacterium]